MLSRKIHRGRSAGLALSLVTIAALAAGGLAQTAAARPLLTQTFLSRPDLHHPARVALSGPEVGQEAGDLFIAPKLGPGDFGAMILSARGRTMWFRRAPRGTQIMDFKEQTLDGQPVLTWWQGQVDMDPYHHVIGTGRGHDYIYDSHYHLVTWVHAGNGLQADIHEFELTPQGTALITAYRRVPADLSKYGGSSKGVIADSVIQEIDLHNRKVLFEWHSMDHVPLSDSDVPAPKDSAAYDYFHINSVKVAPDGNLIVSARNTSAVYEIDRHTGAIIWQVSGKHSSFNMGRGASFHFQHDAALNPDGTLSVFDDESPPAPSLARGLVLKLTFDGAGRPKDATVVASVRRPDKLQVGSQGSMQILPNGHYFVGWGAQPYFSEFDQTGKEVLEGHLPGTDESYRAYEFPWAGAPTTAPRLTIRRTHNGARLFASWNGATAVRHWQALGWTSGKPHVLRRVWWRGLETPFNVRTSARHVEVQALDASGNVLATSKPVQIW